MIWITCFLRRASSEKASTGFWFEWCLHWRSWGKFLVNFINYNNLEQTSQNCTFCKSGLKKLHFHCQSMSQLSSIFLRINFVKLHFYCPGESQNYTVIAIQYHKTTIFSCQKVYFSGTNWAQMCDLMILFDNRSIVLWKWFLKV
jgi:hypothetical protein